MPRDTARLVRVTMSAEGEVLRTRDPGLSAQRVTSWSHEPTRPWIDRAFPMNGSVYGWNIQPYCTGSHVRQPRYAAQVAAAPNDPNDPQDRQTVQVQGAHFVKLDVGFWGNYDMRQLQQAPPQRNFGIIEGPDVWLCNYFDPSHSLPSGVPVPPANPADLIPAAGSLARQLIDQVAAAGKRVVLVSHATIPPSTDAAVPAANKLYVCLPDLHLPEQWPDLYPVANRLAAGRRRATLRALLRKAQCKTGPANDSYLTQSHLDLIQQKLDAWQGGSAETITIQYAVSHTVTYPPRTYPTDPEDPGPPPIITPITVNETYARDEFLAEKAHLDREIQAKSTWFYGGQTTPGTDVTVPAQTDEVDPPVDSTADDPITADPVPGVDLANFLFVLRGLRQSAGASRVIVVQVGDMYELWMNREFMYKEHPTVPTDEIGQVSRDGFVAVTAVAPVNFTESYPDAFQLRMDAEWGAPPHAAKRYVFHQWTRSELYYRHNTAGSPPATALTRLRQRLLDRINGVEAWSFLGPGPESDSRLVPGLQAWIRTKPAGYFQRQNRRGQQETRWNRIMLELLNVELQCKRIHGNHDGYRSDPNLMNNRSHPAACEQWFSEEGIWVEHSHRWDYFNRDGVAMGAGMTNAVYYHNQELIAASGGAAASVLRQEQAFFQPGAAQWYLLVNYGTPASWFDPGVHKWGVYVGGHTHAPDLVKVYYDLATTDEVRAWAAQRRADAEQAARDAAAWMRRQREAAEQAAQRAYQSAADTYRSARARAEELRRRMGQTVRDLLPF